MKPIKTLSLSLCTLAAAGIAAAEPPEPSTSDAGAPRQHRAHTGLMEADLDKDGRVSDAEFRKHHEALFKKADTNGDGQLDRDEVLAMSRFHRGPEGGIPPAPGPEWRAGKSSGSFGRGNPERFFSTLDANEDGKLQRDELPEALAGHFDRLDSDGDGAISPEEMKRMKPDREAIRARLQERMKAMDANGDGLIQESEAPEPMQAHFDKIDANGDGALGSEELKNFRPRHERRAGINQPAGAQPDEPKD